jgi:hypothetical protein
LAKLQIDGYIIRGIRKIENSNEQAGMLVPPSY